MIDCSILMSSLGSFYHLVNRIEGAAIVQEEYFQNNVEVQLSLPEDKTSFFMDTFNAQYVRNATGKLKRTLQCCLH
jgi:hypothetical protein